MFLTQLSTTRFYSFERLYGKIILKFPNLAIVYLFPVFYSLYICFSSQYHNLWCFFIYFCFLCVYMFIYFLLIQLCLFFARLCIGLLMFSMSTIFRIFRYSRYLFSLLFLRNIMMDMILFSYLFLLYVFFVPINMHCIVFACGVFWQSFFCIFISFF